MIHIVLVCQGSEKGSLQKLATLKGLSNVSFLPPIPKTSVLALLESMDACYIGWKNLPIYRFGVSPNKLMDYRIAGKPVIHSINAGKDLGKDRKCGVSLPAEDPQAIAEVMFQLLNSSSQELKEMGKKGHDYVVSHHDYVILAKSFLSGL